MKQYTVSTLRESLAGALDRAERGEPVIIARRGRRFRLVADAPNRPSARAKAFFQVTDPRLLEIGWTWEWTAPGNRLRLKTPRSPKRPR
ncbi:MAG: type II toxin-antitoxin system prevent-host-death family antitoxin [Deltaproteobacteria bacterium]|nr:type II toxin-antitoxin system prevent-host-death family antitoxin [Deltaproteobacteria bacterium]MBI3388176.1 type II toxin-antitoxin system prevent-host-death family antitoxin [Deltaproteobacteria bacterium]